jgi:mono/diheme cytochrome c family protein
MKSRILPFALIFSSLGLLLGAANGEWLAHVPKRDHEKTNPFHDQNEAAKAGELLYSDHCAECHGATAQGHDKRPSLRTQRIQQEASEGDLHWLLINGNLRHGMPSWSKLPDQQLWQLVSYLKTLKPSN